MILDPGVKKASDPGSGSATLKVIKLHFAFVIGKKVKVKSVNWIFFMRRMLVASVADPDPGSGIGCFLTPGSGIRDPE